MLTNDRMLMKRIIVVTTSLSHGGITSFLVPLVNFLTNEGNDVTLAFTKDDGNFIHRFHHRIHLLQYNMLSKKEIISVWCKKMAFYDMMRIAIRKNTQTPHYASIQRLSYITARYVKITKEHYDVAISTAEGLCNAIVANNINADKKIGWIHPDMATLGLDLKAGQRILNKLNYVMAVSEEGCNTLKKFFPRDLQKFLYVENMMDSDNIKVRAQERIDDMPYCQDCLNIVTACRITNDSKRLDRVVRIASILKQCQFEFRWYIIGDGPDTEVLKELVKNNDLQNEIIMLGRRNNPLPYIKQADCFVLTSQFEGKPVVIEEAKILHTPVFVTEYSSAKVQVTSDVGVVVSNVDGLLEIEMAHLLQNDTLLNSLKCSCKSFNYDNTRSIDLIRAII